MRYGQDADVLREVSFQLEPGSFHFLTGPSGAGKTTILRLMYLAQKPSKGRIHMFGRDMAKMNRTELPALRRKIGVVFQDFRLLNNLSAHENVALPLRVAGASRKQIQSHVSELLAWVGLTDKVNAFPSTLSDGEKQRVAIARAVIGRPRLLLADEPTGSIDQDQGLRIMHLFEELNKIGTTTVIATHDRSLIANFSRPELLLQDGRLLKKPVIAMSVKNSPTEPKNAEQ